MVYAQQGDTMIEGTWIPISAELGNQPFPERLFTTMRLILTEDSYTAIVGSVTDKGTLTLHESDKPSTMDILGTEGPNKGKTIPAIFELNGETLKVCYDLEGKNRPHDFHTEPRTQQFLVSYRKEKT
jgi:uncharacterized protein (TIGR03067 family)